LQPNGNSGQAAAIRFSILLSAMENEFGLAMDSLSGVCYMNFWRARPWAHGPAFPGGVSH
ncbi:MAG: hypothetical protein ACRD4Y_12415, partial [Candidatus Acidiferrales bacterium]